MPREGVWLASLAIRHAASSGAQFMRVFAESIVHCARRGVFWAWQAARLSSLRGDRLLRRERVASVGLVLKGPDDGEQAIEPDGVVGREVPEKGNCLPVRAEHR